MPKENKMMRKTSKQMNDSSSAHYERSKAKDNHVDAPSFDDYGKLLEESIGANDPLFEARTKSFLSGLPVIGPMVQAYDRSQQLEDYYKNTGKVPSYPGINSPGGGYSQLGSVVGNGIAAMVGKIADGTNDLYQFYAGEPDQFRNMMNGAYL